MTKEPPMTKARFPACTAVSHSSFGFRHSLVIVVLSLGVRLLTLAIRVYQLTVSPLLVFLFGPTGGCRFTPSCSQYAVDAIRSRGVLAGSSLAVRRICRCHPWGDAGHDPAPEVEFGTPNSELRF